MDRTPFAGLTRLRPEDFLSDDGYSFQDGNPVAIDYFLRTGALTHRHDAHPAMDVPTIAPTVAQNPTGGSIPADLTIYVGYTLLDPDGGETTLQASGATITTPPGLADPVTGPLLAYASGSGTLIAGDYSYAVTVTDGAGGESGLGPAETITVDTGSDNNEITVSDLTDIVAESGGTGWRLWRQVNGGEWNLVESGTVDEIVDDGTLCPDCNQLPPEEGTGNTNATNQLLVTVPSPQPFQAVSFRIYASTDGTFSNPALLGEYPIADLDALKTFNSLTFIDGAPPPVSRAIGGPSLITIAEIDWDAEVEVQSSAASAGLRFGSGFVEVAEPVQLAYTGPGIVSMWGRVTKQGSAPADGDVVILLDPAHTPLYTRYIAVTTGDDTPTRDPGALDITALTGEVIWRAGAAGANAWLSLDGASYHG